MRNGNQILRGDQTKCEEISAQSTTNADARSVCGSSTTNSGITGKPREIRICAICISVANPGPKTRPSQYMLITIPNLVVLRLYKGTPLDVRLNRGEPQIWLALAPTLLNGRQLADPKTRRSPHALRCRCRTLYFCFKRCRYKYRTERQN